ASARAGCFTRLPGAWMVSHKPCEDMMAERLTLPVLPLRETVVFPGVAVPITAGRPGTIEAVQAAMHGDHRVFAVSQVDNIDDVTPEALNRVGVIARIV